MSNYYLGDPCYVIPDSEWDDFCQIMRTDGEEFQYLSITLVFQRANHGTLDVILEMSLY